MTKIVIAPDSFKECLSARAVARALSKGIVAGVGYRVKIVVMPIADGGEGTLEALTVPAERRRIGVTGPAGRSVSAMFGIKGETAIVEMARAAGLTLISESARRAAGTTTYGVGQLIRAALDEGAKHILLTVGGSATNDGGCGMLAALGARFRRADGTAFLPTGGTLGAIAQIDTAALDPRLAYCRVTVATDVQNPLCGETGATRMFAPQKGATPAEIERMEAGMARYGALLARLCGRDVANTAGCGAGGGIAAPLLAFAGAKIVSGADAVLDALGFCEAIKGAAAVLTGEGKLDRQSVCGKAVSGVVRACKGSVPVYAFAGRLGAAREELLPLGLAGIYTVRDLAASDEDSMANAKEYLAQLAKTFAKENLCGAK